MTLDSCDPLFPTHNDECCAPTGPTPRADLEPRVERAGGSAYPWRITCPGAETWAGGWKLKRDAAAALAGLSEVNRRRWLDGAYEALWFAGRLVADDPGEAGRACGPWHREPALLQHPDEERPDWAACGRPVVHDDLWRNTPHDLARIRLGWTEARASAAYVAPSWDRDRETWYAAVTRAGADLRAGIADDEAARLGVPERLRPYLRLEYARDLGHYLHNERVPSPSTIPAGERLEDLERGRT